MKRIKSFIMAVLTLAIFGTFSLMLVGCKDDNDQALTFENAYDYSAIAGIGILNAQVDETQPTGYSANYGQLTDAQKEDIVNNLAIAQNLANNGIIKTATTTSNKQGYAKMHTIKATDFTGTEQEYVFHYNETVTEKKNEKVYRLNGVVLYGGEEYTMVGVKEIENNETEFEFKISIDNQNYVVIEQEAERDETEYGYTAYKNGVKVYETELELEIKPNNKVELTFEIFDRDNNIAQEYTYLFEEVNGENFAKIKIENGPNTTVIATVKIVKTANGYQYTFID